METQAKVKVGIQVVLFLLLISLTAVSSYAQTVYVTPKLGGQIAGTESRITYDPGDQYDPHISGNIIVFTDFRAADADVYWVDLSTMQEHRVVVAPGDQHLTDVSNGLIVYTDYRTCDVILYNTNDGTTVNLTQPDKIKVGYAFYSIDPAISGNLVAWEDSRDGNMEIYAKDIVTGEERRISNSPLIDEKPAVGNVVITWESCVLGGNCDIYSYNWASGEIRQITNTPEGDERWPDTDGRRIFYHASRNGEIDVCIFDLATNVEKCLSLPGAQVNPHISGDFVSFEDVSNGIYHVKVWYLATRIPCSM